MINILVFFSFFFFFHVWWRKLAREQCNEHKMPFHFVLDLIIICIQIHWLNLKSIWKFCLCFTLFRFASLHFTMHRTHNIQANRFECCCKWLIFIWITKPPINIPVVYFSLFICRTLSAPSLKWQINIGKNRFAFSYWIIMWPIKSIRNSVLLTRF